MTEEDKIIGEHPVSPNLFGDWLSVEDTYEVNGKKHRKLDEINSYRNIVGVIAQWIVKHHVREADIKSLRSRKRRIQKKYGFEKYVDSLAYLPDDENTKKGNGAEVIFSKYIQDTLKKKLFIYKLRYNPNTSQSMKGDDILLLDPANLKDCIYLGEAKFRVPASRNTVNEILASIGGNPKLPLSLTFLSGIARDAKKEKLANDLQDLQVEMKDDRIPVESIGFIMSNDKAHDCVVNHHLYGDFALNSKALNEISTTTFPLDLSHLLGIVFRTEKQLFDQIRADLKVAKYPTSKLTDQVKSIIIEHSDKVLNPNMLFVTLASNDANKIIEVSFDLAKQILHDIKDQKGNFIEEMIDTVLAKLMK